MDSHDNLGRVSATLRAGFMMQGEGSAYNLCMVAAVGMIIDSTLWTNVSAFVEITQVDRKYKVYFLILIS